VTAEIWSLANRGTVLSNDVIPVIAAEDERAEFTIKGGKDVIAFCVEGFSDYKIPSLFMVTQTEGTDEVAPGFAIGPISLESVEGKGDGVQVYMNEKGEYGFVFLFNTGGGEYQFKVEHW